MFRSYGLWEKIKLKQLLMGKNSERTPPPPGGIKAVLHRPKYSKFNQKPGFFRACGALLGTLLSLKHVFDVFRVSNNMFTFQKPRKIIIVILLMSCGWVSIGFGTMFLSINFLS